MPTPIGLTSLSGQTPPIGEYDRIQSAEQFDRSEEKGLFLEYLYTRARPRRDDRIRDCRPGDIPAPHRGPLLELAAQGLKTTRVKTWAVTLPSVAGGARVVGYVLAKKGDPTKFFEVGVYFDAKRPQGFLQYAAPQQYSGTKR